MRPLCPALLFAFCLGCGAQKMFEVRPWLKPKPSEFGLLEDAPADRHLAYGLAYESEGKMREAIGHYRLALESPASKPKALLGIARASFVKGELRKALDAGTQALELDPELAGELNDFLWTQASQGRTPRCAVRLMEMAIPKAGARASALWDTLAFIHLQRDEPDQAEACLAEAEKLADEPLRAWILFHRSLVAKRRGDEALAKDLEAQARRQAESLGISLE